MLFNSFAFAVFFVIVYLAYLLAPHRWQNRLLLVASYVFYGTWDWRFLGLIWISTVLDYVCGLKIAHAPTPRRRKRWLSVSVVGNLAILGFFKYYDFFAESLEGFLGHLGFSVQPRFLRLILPVGISFYTFQTMSYSIDIYRRQMQPTRRFLDFALFVAFFPQLVAGPIERAKRLLPQVLAPRQVTLTGCYQGCYLIFWGLFQKVFVADNLAPLVNSVFSSAPPYHGAIVLVAFYACAFQIYYDFAGYSNIARGLGRCMGFELMVNFRNPFFSTNVAELWTRWHISLSTWLKDYCYDALGGGKGGRWRRGRNVVLVFLLGGLWHGASWTFVTWGLCHALMLILYFQLVRPWLGRRVSPRGTLGSTLWFALRVGVVFHLWCFVGVFFRAETIAQALAMLGGIFWNFPGAPWVVLSSMVAQLVFFLWLVVLVECVEYRTNDATAMMKIHPFLRVAFYYVALMLLVLWGVHEENAFLYFQF